MEEIKKIKLNLENSLIEIDNLLLKLDKENDGALLRTINGYLKPSISILLNSGQIGSIKDIEFLLSK